MKDLGLCHAWSSGCGEGGSRQRTGLGYNPRTVYDDGERWGQGSGRQWLPSGLVIPCWMGGELWYVKVRRDDPEARERYVCARGSRKRGVMYGVDGLGVGDVIICEGELNALTLRQELGGVCGAVSVGDAGNVPGAEALGLWWGSRGGGW